MYDFIDGGITPHNPVIVLLHNMDDRLYYPMVFWEVTPIDGLRYWKAAARSTIGFRTKAEALRGPTAGTISYLYSQMIGKYRGGCYYTIDLDLEWSGEEPGSIEHFNLDELAKCEGMMLRR